MSIDASKAINFTKNYNNLKTTIQNQRLSVMGVDTDEEAMDLVKFQQAYNLSSKMMTVMNQYMTDLLIIQVYKTVKNSSPHHRGGF